MTATSPGAVIVLAHGRMPVTWDEWIVWAFAALATAWVLWKCVAWTITPPGEDAPDHVKWSILDDPRTAPAGASAGGPPPASPPPHASPPPPPRPRSPRATPPPP